jgi:hypothetical protein
LCEIDIDLFSIYSPNLKDSEMIVKIQLGKLLMLFHPETINDTIKYFRHIKYQDYTDLEGLHQQLIKDVDFDKPIMFENGHHKESKQNTEVVLAKKQNCKDVSIILMKIEVFTDGLRILNLHPQYY